MKTEKNWREWIRFVLCTSTLPENATDDEIKLNVIDAWDKDVKALADARQKLAGKWEWDKNKP